MAPQILWVIVTWFHVLLLICTTGLVINMHRECGDGNLPLILPPPGDKHLCIITILGLLSLGITYLCSKQYV